MVTKIDWQQSEKKKNKKIMQVCTVVWMWLHQKYGMSQIRKTFYSFKTNNSSYLSDPGDGQLNQQNNETYDLQCTYSKIIMFKNNYQSYEHAFYY